MKSRTVLITGAGRGIGRAIALRFADSGCAVFVNFYVNRDAAEETAGEIIRRGGTAELVQADLKDPDQIAAMFAMIQRQAGGLDVLVNNAASGVLRGVLDLSPKHWDWILNTNLRPLLLCAKEAALLMGPGGRIISISSLGAWRVVPNYAGVGVSKAALEALTRYLAVDLAGRGITVNAVSAGAVDTGIWRAFPEGGTMLPAIRSRTPGGRLVTPEELAEVVFFLASAASQPIQGQVIVVDGGYSLLA